MLFFERPVLVAPTCRSHRTQPIRRPPRAIAPEADPLPFFPQFSPRIPCPVCLTNDSVPGAISAGKGDIQKNDRKSPSRTSPVALLMTQKWEEIHRKIAESCPRVPRKKARVTSRPPTFVPSVKCCVISRSGIAMSPTCCAAILPTTAPTKCPSPRLPRAPK